MNEDEFVTIKNIHLELEMIHSARKTKVRMR